MSTACQSRSEAVTPRALTPPVDWRPLPPKGPGTLLRNKFRPPLLRGGWLLTGLITAVAFALRTIGISHPQGLIFDEVYYAQNAHEMLQHGVEWNANENVSAYVAHPPFGKWLIAVGESMFGYNELGWRISAAVAGTLMVLLLIRLAYRLTGSILLGAFAGILLAVEGSHLVLSRVALLDIFLAALVLAAFYCLVRDREWQRERWLHSLETKRRRPAFAWPWWRIATAVVLGLAMSVKWSALWFILAFALLICFWEWRVRVEAGVRRPLRDTFINAYGHVASFFAISAASYLATWTGWFINSEGAFRQWLAENGHASPPVVGPLVNWFQYHLDILDFHSELDTEHSYQSTVVEWLFNLKPVVFFWSSDVECEAEDCASQVLLLGTPVLWWAFVPAMIALLLWGIAKSDWRAGTILFVAAAGIAPWLMYPERTMFFFYTAPSVPFMVLAVVMCLGMILGKRTDSMERRLTGALICGAFVAIVVLCFAYFWPIYTGVPIPYEEWQARMWLGSRWI